MVESSMSPAIIKDAVQTTRLVVSTASLRLAVIWRFWGFRLSAQKALMRGGEFHKCRICMPESRFVY